MKELIDIHSHILPGVDDGADSFEMSMRMLKCAADDGISGMILTPHNKPWHTKIDHTGMRARVDQLQKRLCQEGLAIKLYTGSELYYRGGLAEELDQGAVETLADSQYVLVEFDPLADYDYIRNGIYALLSGGYYPIAAHTERYRNVCCKTNGIIELTDMGCFIQVNAGSIMGKYGSGTKFLTRKMLKEDLVHFIATDAHDLYKRNPCLSQCAQYIGKKYGESSAKRLFYDNPMCVLRGEYIRNREED